MNGGPGGVLFGVSPDSSAAVVGFELISTTLFRSSQFFVFSHEHYSSVIAFLRLLYDSSLSSC